MDIGNMALLIGEIYLFIASSIYVLVSVLIYKWKLEEVSMPKNLLKLIKVILYFTELITVLVIGFSSQEYRFVWLNAASILVIEITDVFIEFLEKRNNLIKA